MKNEENNTVKKTDTTRNFHFLKTKKKLVILFALIIIICLLSTYLWCCQNVLETENYNIETDKISASVKIAFISDMHHKEFGKDNFRLVRKIREQNPDLIAVGGDMVSNSDTDHKCLINLLEKLTDIAPVYFAYGNHENRYVNKIKMAEDIRNTGTILLDNEYTNFSTPEMNGEKIIIGGLSDYPYYEKYYPHYQNDERFFLDEFISLDKENYCILLAHQPEFYMWKLHEYEIDLILSGHTHGGLIQLPFVGGVFAPTQNFFPEYDEGYFSNGNTSMIVTSGLGVSSSFTPRINNNPEVCIITINP